MQMMANVAAFLQLIAKFICMTSVSLKGFFSWAIGGLDKKGLQLGEMRLAASQPLYNKKLPLKQEFLEKGKKQDKCILVD